MRDDSIHFSVFERWQESSMVTTETCLSDAELRRFDAGELSAADAERFTRHFDSCTGCAERLTRLPESADELVAHLRSPLPVELLAEDSEIRALVAQAAAAQETGSTALGGTSPDLVRRKKLELDQLVREVLTPPQSEGELGRLGGYRVLSVLGTGGMGAVFRAEDLRLKRQVALKVMRPTLAREPDARERFLREAQAAAALSHDHITPVYQVGEDREVLFLAMPLLQGETLGARLRREKPLPMDEALRITREAAAGLAAAHERGLIHRDIKPDNLWLEAGSGRVKILDFGLARAVEGSSQITHSGLIVGTPNYLSPEQANGSPVDARSDLFSLGVVLYEMLTGRKPFERQSLTATLSAIADADPEPLQFAQPETPDDVADLVDRLLAKNPAARFATALEVVHAARATDGTKVASSPLATTGAQQPPARRSSHWTSAGWIAGGLALLAAIIVILRDRDGREIARVTAPGAVTAEVLPGGASPAASEPVVPEPSTTVEPAAAVAAGEFLPPMHPWAIVQQPAKLPAYQGKEVTSWSIVPGVVLPGEPCALREDGNRLATYGSDGTVRVWNVDDDDLTLRTALIGDGGSCFFAGQGVHKTTPWHRTNSRLFGPIAWQPGLESQFLATASRDGAVRVWDVERGIIAWQQPGERDSVNLLAWSPDGQQLAAGYGDGKVRVWTANTWEEHPALQLTDGPAQSFVWSPDSQRIAVQSAAYGAQVARVTVWGPLDGQRQVFDGVAGFRSLFNGFASFLLGVPEMRWSPDGKLLALQRDRELVLLETSEWQPQIVLSSDLPAETVIRVEDFAWSPDCQWILVSWNGQLVLHDLDSGERSPIPLPEGHLAFLLDWAPAGSRIAIGTTLSDGMYTLFIDPQSLTVQPVSGSENFGTHISEFSADGRRAVMRSGYYAAAVAEFNDDHSLAWWRVPDHTQTFGAPQSRLWSPDGSQVAIALGGEACLYAAGDSLSSAVPSRMKLDHICSWSLDSSRLLAYEGTTGVEYALWSAVDGQRLCQFPLTSRLFTPPWSPKGDRFASADLGKILISDGTTGALVQSYTMPDLLDGQVTALAWSRDGERLAYLAPNEVPPLRVLDGEATREQMAISKIRAGSLFDGLLWSPEDRWLLVVGTEELDVYRGDDGQPGVTFAVPASPRAIQFVDADTAICGTRDGFVYRLDLATGQQQQIAANLESITELSPDRQWVAVDHGGQSRLRCLAGPEAGRGITFCHIGNRVLDFVVDSTGHFWTPGISPGPFWTNSAGGLVYVVQTADGQTTLTAGQFAERYRWENDPSKVQLP
jgi:WD40 repeat protein/predicted Ser/Thr protein kinase